MLGNGDAQEINPRTWAPGPETSSPSDAVSKRRGTGNRRSRPALSGDDTQTLPGPYALVGITSWETGCVGAARGRGAQRQRKDTGRDAPSPTCSRGHHAPP